MAGVAETLVDCVCDYCGKKLRRTLGHYNRGLKFRKGKQYCNNSCAARDRKDERSSFRIYIRRAKDRYDRKKLKVEITPEYLKKLWDQQEGKCAVSGVKLTHNEYGQNKHYNQASLDRIDNAKGYVEGNVRFVLLMVNYGMNTFGTDKFIEICREVTKHNS